MLALTVNRSLYLSYPPIVPMKGGRTSSSAVRVNLARLGGQQQKPGDENSLCRYEPRRRQDIAGSTDSTPAM